MRRSSFVPARSSRHRASALALYRALIRSAHKVDAASSCAGANTVKAVVEKQFRKNTAYTSSRLVYSSMVAGYKVRRAAKEFKRAIHANRTQYLSFLGTAKDPVSLEYSQIQELLEQKQAESVKDRARAAQRKPKRKRYQFTEADALRAPLLCNTASAGEMPQYVTSRHPNTPYMPDGTRKTPRLATTAFGQPFLRLNKPQPYALSRMIGKKNQIFEDRIKQIVLADEVLSPEAALEDAWDALVEVQLHAEGLLQQTPPKPDIQETYVWSVQLSRIWWEWQVERTWHDWLARGKALHQVVTAHDAATASHSSTSRAGSSTSSESASVTVQRGTTFPYSVLGVSKASLAKGLHDSFRDGAWAQVIESQKPRLVKWANAALGHGSATPSGKRL